MRNAAFLLICLICLSLAANAQQKKTFVKPFSLPSEELFPKNSKRASDFNTNSLETVARSFSFSLLPTANLPQDYNWRQEIYRDLFIKKIAFEQNNFRCWTPKPTPAENMSQHVVEQFFIRNSSN